MLLLICCSSCSFTPSKQISFTAAQNIWFLHLPTHTHPQRPGGRERNDVLPLAFKIQYIAQAAGEWGRARYLLVCTVRYQTQDSEWLPAVGSWLVGAVPHVKGMQLQHKCSLSLCPRLALYCCYQLWTGKMFSNETDALIGPESQVHWATPWSSRHADIT